MPPTRHTDAGASGRQGLSLPEAPTFRPTAAQFSDPLAYIASIREQAEPFGMCKIVPEGIKPASALGKKVRFATQVQLVHEMQERSDDPAFDAAFQQQYASFMRRQGSKGAGIAKLGSQAVELSRLLRVVLRKGGHQAVCDAKAWRDVCRMLGVRSWPAAPGFFDTAAGGA